MSVPSLDYAAQQERVRRSPEGEEKKLHGSSFYRGENCNFNPYGNDHLKANYASHFILKGWMPDSRFIQSDTTVTAFGSCFAENISHHLASIGFNTSKKRDSGVYISLMGEGLVNVHSILQQFKWALEGWSPPSNLWHGYDACQFDLDDRIRVRTKEVFLSTEVFIITFGLSEIWYDEVTGGVFWRAVPLKNYDASRHKFRVCSFQETKSSISEICNLILAYKPDAKIIMTVSPIPLITTFRSSSCITANAASKAIIKAALDELMRDLDDEQRQKVFYYPAFELINECFPNRFIDDGRHLQSMIVPAVMRLFEANFCQTDLTLESAEREFHDARIENASSLRRHPLFSEAFASLSQA